MRNKLRGKFSLLFLAFALLLAVPAIALASSVGGSVVDTIAPTGSVTLSPGNSGNIQINYSVTGNQDGTATFQVFKDWTLSGGTFTGSNPQTVTVGPRAGGDPATTGTVNGTVSVASGQAAGGPFSLQVNAFNITNSNATGGKLAAGTFSTYQVTVQGVTDPCAGVTDPAAPVISATPNSPNGSNDWYNTVPSVSAASSTSGATITYATKVLPNGAKSAYSSTPPTLGQGTTEVFAKATSATCNRVSESSRVFMVDSIAPDVNPASVVNTVWRNSPLSETFTSSDSTSGLADSANDASFTLTAADESSNSSTPTVDSRTVYDVAGNSTTRSVSAKIDLTKPVISGADIIQTAWRNSPLSASFSTSDALSDLANPLDSSFTLATSGDSPDANTPVTDSKTVSDNAGNFDTRTISAFVDTGNPTISGSASPAPNANGWNKTNVDVSFTCGDSLSGIASCGPDQTLSTEGSGQSASGTATDNAGNSVSTTVSGINIDKTAPSVNCGSADGNWHANDVSIACTASDALSHLANSGDASFNLSTSVANGTETSNASTGNRTVSDNADNSTQAGPISGNMVDKKAPTFGACPAAGPFTQGTGSQPVGSINATDGGSGVDTANSTLIGSVDTSSIGTKTVNFAAKDIVGNSATTTCSYNVNYNWTGFFQPIDNGVMNVAKAGSTIPVKFSLGSNQGLSIFWTGTPNVSYPSVGKISCTADPTQDAIEEYSTATVSGLKYDSTANQYIYNWKTASNYAGSCQQLIIRLADGTYHRADFKFTK
jgi:hypothetical protein